MTLERIDKLRQEVFGLAGQAKDATGEEKLRLMALALAKTEELADAALAYDKENPLGDEVPSVVDGPDAIESEALETPADFIPDPSEAATLLPVAEGPSEAATLLRETTLDETPHLDENGQPETELGEPHDRPTRLHEDEWKEPMTQTELRKAIDELEKEEYSQAGARLQPGDMLAGHGTQEEKPEVVSAGPQESQDVDTLMLDLLADIRDETQEINAKMDGIGDESSGGPERNEKGQFVGKDGESKSEDPFKTLMGLGQSLGYFVPAIGQAVSHIQAVVNVVESMSNVVDAFSGGEDEAKAAVEPERVPFAHAPRPWHDDAWKQEREAAAAEREMTDSIDEPEGTIAENAERDGSELQDSIDKLTEAVNGLKDEMRDKGGSSEAGQPAEVAGEPSKAKGNASNVNALTELSGSAAKGEEAAAAIEGGSAVTELAEEVAAVGVLA